MVLCTIVASASPNLCSGKCYCGRSAVFSSSLCVEGPKLSYGIPRRPRATQYKGGSQGKGNRTPMPPDYPPGFTVPLGRPQGNLCDQPSVIGRTQGSLWERMFFPIFLQTRQRIGHQQGGGGKPYASITSSTEITSRDLRLHRTQL